MADSSITRRMDAVAGPARAGGAPRVPAPRAVRVDLSANCGAGCRFCAQRRRQKRRGEMDMAFYQRLVGQVVDAGVAELGVSFLGESFLCDWLPDAIEFAKRRGMPWVYLSTNGTLATPQRVDECMRAGLDAIRFSLDAPDAIEFIDEGRAPSAIWHGAAANLKCARAMRDAGVYRCGLYASSLACGGERQARMQRVVDAIRPYVDEHHWRPAGPGGAPPPCSPIFTEAHVTHDGKLAACCLDTGEAWVMADLYEQRFMEGWNSPAFMALRAAHLGGNLKGTPCESCAGNRERLSPCLPARPPGGG